MRHPICCVVMGFSCFSKVYQIQWVYITSCFLGKLNDFQKVQHVGNTSWFSLNAIGETVIPKYFDYERIIFVGKHHPR